MGREGWRKLVVPLDEETYRRFYVKVASMKPPKKMAPTVTGWIGEYLQGRRG